MPRQHYHHTSQIYELNTMAFATDVTRLLYCSPQERGSSLPEAHNMPTSALARGASFVMIIQPYLYR
jgi:hypothetical protein